MKRLWIFVLLCVPLVATPPSRADPPEGVNLRKTVVVDVVQKTKDAVVYVSTTKLITRRVNPFGDMGPFWQDFGQVTQVPANSLGSGFIIHSEGYVITNNHVIDRAREINVELADGRKMPAELVSADPDADLAVLKLVTDKPGTFPTIELGDSSDLMIGEPAIAVGNPLGFSHSVSTGIVSALHRDLKGANEKTALADLIQTDAAINPGNSGGPLLNAYGQVIGINTAIRSDAQNIGFAIPVNRLRDLIPDLMNPSQVTKVDVGLKVREVRRVVPPAKVEVMLREIGPDGKDGPEVKAINGSPVHTDIDVYDMLLKVHAGDKLVVTTGDGRKQEIATRAMPLPDAVVQAKQLLGIGVEELTPLEAQKRQLSTDDGLYVTSVARGSVAAKSGLRVGDVIVMLGRYRVAKLKDLSTLLPRMPSSGRVRISVVRGDQVLSGALEFGEMEQD